MKATCMLSTAHTECAGVAFNWLCMLSWVRAGPEGCRGLTWVPLATHGHCAVTGIGLSAVLKGSQSKVDF